jgi:hypothetical protein
LWPHGLYLAGNHIGTIYGYITRYSYYVLIAAVVLLTGYITRRVLRRRQRTAGQDREPASAEPAERDPGGACQ